MDQTRLATGFPKAVLHDCRKDLDAAVSSIARAIDGSSADDPLYFVLAGPMDVPSRGIEKSDPAKRRFVWCIPTRPEGSSPEPSLCTFCALFLARVGAPPLIQKQL